MKTAFITGITGMDGSYLAELLLEKGYTVHGLQRPSSTINTGRIDHIYDRLQMHYGDITDGERIYRLLREIEPNEVYNLAAQSHVRISFDLPEYTKNVNYEGFGWVRRAIFYDNYAKHIKLYQASSSEIFGNADTPTQNERTYFSSCSPYANSKIRAHQEAVHSRKTENMWNVCGILFNHTSERQKETFITRKITKAAARIKLGLQKELYLGNLEAKRDFGHARDYVRAMWMMMQHYKPDDFVIATGEQHSVKEILDEAFGYLNLDWHDYVKINPRLYRPTELHSLCGDATKAREVLGWQPETTFQQLVREMVDADARMIQVLAPSYAALSL